jgi:hypothetical protein
MVTGACELCEGGSTASRLIGACAGFVVFLGVLLWYLYKLNKTEQEADEARHREEEVAGGRIRTARLSAHVGIDKARALKPAFKSVYQYVQVERASAKEGSGNAPNEVLPPSLASECPDEKRCEHPEQSSPNERVKREANAPNNFLPTSLPC